MQILSFRPQSLISTRLVGWDESLSVSSFSISIPRNFPLTQLKIMGLSKHILKCLGEDADWQREYARRWPYQERRTKRRGGVSLREEEGRKTVTPKKEYIKVSKSSTSHFGRWICNHCGKPEKCSSPKSWKRDRRRKKYLRGRVNTKTMSFRENEVEGQSLAIATTRLKCPINNFIIIFFVLKKGYHFE